MQIIETIAELKSIIKDFKNNKKTIGFVPTMGYLHEGHLSLLQKAKEQNDIVVLSIFVNPTQFGKGEDFESYPKKLDKDALLAKEVGTDILFQPSVTEMYPGGYKTFVDVETITNALCGKSRPGHFKGVTTVVNKLFNIVTPDRAYFGQKDAQQVAVIEQMVRDLSMNLEIIPCPIIREADGLAMSSRNVYLTADERKAALILSRSLFDAKKRIEQGEKNADLIKDYISNTIQKEPLAQIDYIEIVNAVTLEDLQSIDGDVLIALAVKFGKARLIDNIRLEVSSCY